MKLIIHVQTGA